MDYKVIITEDAEADMDKFVQYLLFEKKNEQAAGNLQDDFEATISTLVHAAENLKMCENPYLKDIGYRRINFINGQIVITFRTHTSTTHPQTADVLASTVKDVHRMAR